MAPSLAHWAANQGIVEKFSSNRVTGPCVPNSRTTREKLLKVAREELTGFGWDASTEIAIRKRAGVPSGSARHFFPGGKVDLGAAVFVRISRELWDPVLEELVGADNPQLGRVAISAALNRLWRNVISDRSTSRTYFALEAVLPGTLAGPTIASERGRLVEAVGGWLTGMRDNSVRLSAVPLAFALVFGSELEVLRNWAFGEDLAPDESVPLPLSGLAAEAIFGAADKTVRRRK